MARRPRLRLAAVPMHVIQRGNNRGGTFFSAADYSFYLDTLEHAARRYGCVVHAYVLMTNHVHLLLTPIEPDAMSLVLQDLGRRYVRYVNKAYARTGTLWEGRFKASLVDAAEYVMTCSRYIELNPVRAGIVANPADYRWSSYRHNALGEPNRYLTVHPVYRGLAASLAECSRAYQALFGDDLPEERLTEIRAATNSGWPIGGQRFKDEIEAMLNRAACPPKRGRPPKLSAEM